MGPVYSARRLNRAIFTGLSDLATSPMTAAATHNRDTAVGDSYCNRPKEREREGEREKGRGEEKGEESDKKRRRHAGGRDRESRDYELFNLSARVVWPGSVPSVCARYGFTKARLR